MGVPDWDGEAYGYISEVHFALVLALVLVLVLAFVLVLGLGFSIFEVRFSEKDPDSNINGSSACAHYLDILTS